MRGPQIYYESERESALSFIQVVVCWHPLPRTVAIPAGHREGERERERSSAEVELSSLLFVFDKSPGTPGQYLIRTSTPPGEGEEILMVK